MIDTAPSNTNWTLAQKLGFRFFMLFFIQYIFLNPNGVLPGINAIYNSYIGVFHKVIIWMAAHVLHITRPIGIVQTGSGDTTYDYLIMLMITIVSIAGTVIWSLTDSKRLNYNRLFYWLAVMLRFYVAITMVSYGYVKIIKLQFPAPSPIRLMETVGNMSPMGLAWTYMGYSVGFNYFAGLAELTCALLLFFRRTTTTGAMVGIVVAGNIMAVNYCFDVPVKILSTMLVAMCLFLVIKDLRRVINFFFLNKTAQPANLAAPRFNKKWINIVLALLKYGLMTYVLIGYFVSYFKIAKTYGDNAPKPQLYGIYNVQTFIRNHDTLPPLNTDTTRWNKLAIDNNGRATIRLMNDSTRRYQFNANADAHTITLNTFDRNNYFALDYTIIKPDTLLLKGEWKKDTLQIRLVRYNLNKFLLNNRGFHWINEAPFNR
jgi:hypothetical protein